MCDANEHELGPLGIDYIKLYSCHMEGWEFIAILMFLAWTAFLIYLRKHYFTLLNSHVHSWKHCRYVFFSLTRIYMRKTGVTFLAMGNGAPDVFASVTSFTTGVDTLIGIAALLGASVFVTSIVVGTLALLSPCKVDPIVFTRDIFFHVTAFSTVTLIGFMQYVNIGMALGFFVIYAVYVAIVMASLWYKNEEILREEVVGVQAAFWHINTKKAQYKPQSQNVESGYEFLTLGTKDDDDEECTINLSGSLMSAEFNHDIVDDYFPQPQTAKKLPAFDGIIQKDESELKTSFIERSERPSKKRSTLWSQLYYQQMQMKKRLQRSIFQAEWWEYSVSMKILSIIEFPFVVARDATIPTVDDALWSKYYATVQPLCAPLLLLYTTGYFSKYIWVFPLPLLVFIASTPLSAFIYLTTHHGRPPQGSVYGTVWVLVAFVMCIVWIYLLAGELVACLSAIGGISGIPTSVLGLTVLAWGNSVGDFFANVAVAKQGLGEMAIAGCYGGPVFNLLVGLGLSFTYVCSVYYPLPFDLTLDVSAAVSLGFLYLILLSTYIYTAYHGFELRKELGYFLIGLYCLYTVVQLCIVLF